MDEMPPKAPVPEGGPAPDADRGGFLLALSIPLIALLVYSNSFSVPFHFDDFYNIRDNPAIKDLSNFRDFSSSRAVGFLTFALNYRAGGLDPAGYHGVNLAIHVANAFLLLALLRLLLGRCCPDLPAGRRTWIVFFSVLLFTVHPIQTQSVTYIVQRFTSLVATFYMASVAAYLLYRTAPENGRTRIFWYVLSLASAVLAMKTKENAFTLPLMLVLVEILFFRPALRKNGAMLLPFLLTMAIIPLSRIEALRGTDPGFARQGFEIGRLDYLLTQPRVILTYLRLLILPVGQNLDYDYPVRHSLLDPSVFIPMLFLGLLSGWAVFVLLRTRPGESPVPLAAFGVLWFFITLSIESSVIPLDDVIYEHRLYLPSAGFFPAAAVLADRAFGLVPSFIRRRTAVWILSGLLLATLGAAAHQRNRVWADEVALWSDVTAKSPRKARGYNNLGVAHQNRGDWEEALGNFQTAVALAPDHSGAYVNLSVLYRRRNRPDLALPPLETALRLAPNNPHAHNQLGLIHLDRGEYDRAIAAFNRAIALKPDDVPAHNNLGTAYKSQGKPDDAVRAYETAVRLDPDAPEPRLGLGPLYGRMGRYEEARRALESAMRLRPDDVVGRYNLGVVYEKLNRIEEARREYNRALEIQPDFESARGALDRLPPVP